MSPGPGGAPSPELAWRTALEVVRRLEGGFGNHATDPGGATKYGITRATLAGWRQLSLARVTVDDVRQLTWAEAAEIYEANYWRAAHCDVCAAAGRASLALAHFDWSVNGGVARARWYLQAALTTTEAGVHLVVDGVIGPRTRAAIASLSPLDELVAVRTYLGLRLAHYRIRAMVGTPTDEQRLVVAELARFLPQPSPDARGWFHVWVTRLRRIAVACGLTPDSVAPLSQV